MSQPSRSEFERHYREHSGPLLAFLLARVVPRTDAEEVAQEVWLRAWNGLAGFDGRNFRPWLFGIARNYLIDRSRKRATQPLPAEYDATDPRTAPADALIQREHQERLERCLGRLGEKDLALVRGRLAGETFEALSTSLGLSRTEAHRLFHDAKTRLQECVKRDET
jgi:RNA polymerase sigma-70 factor (ECF subfamily)